MTTTKATGTDCHGFPTRTCTRCGGSGHYAFNRLDGTTCYGCSGTGTQYATKRASAAVAAFRKAQRNAARPQVCDFQAGDVVTFDMTSEARALPTATWRTVAAVTVTPMRCGSSLTGTDESARVFTYYRAVTYTDGTTEVYGATRLALRRGVIVDPAPFVAQALGR